MSNLMINWRFWTYHFQVVRLRDWRSELRMHRLPFRLSRNRAHAIGGSARSWEHWKRVELYEGAGWFWLALALVGLAILWTVL